MAKNMSELADEIEKEGLASQETTETKTETESSKGEEKENQEEYASKTKKRIDQLLADREAAEHVVQVTHSKLENLVSKVEEIEKLIPARDQKTRQDDDDIMSVLEDDQKKWFQKYEERLRTKLRTEILGEMEGSVMQPLGQIRQQQMIQGVVTRFLSGTPDATQHQEEIAKVIGSDRALALAAASKDPEIIGSALALAWQTIRPRVQAEIEKTKAASAKAASSRPETESVTTEQLAKVRTAIKDFREIAKEVEEELRAKGVL